MKSFSERRNCTYLHRFLHIIFGDLNGIQIFLAPLTLAYLVRSESILTTVTSLFSDRIHYFPLFIFLITLLFVIFTLIKLWLYNWDRPNDFVDKIIELNLSVLTVVLIALIYYAISAFLSYFYGIKGGLKPGLALLYKIYTSSVVIYYFAYHTILSGYLHRGYGQSRAIKCFYAWLRVNKLLFIRYSVMSVVAIIASVRMYQLILVYAYHPAIEVIHSLTNVDLRFDMVPLLHIGDVFANMFILFLACAVSSVIYYPVGLLVKRLILTLNPIKLK